MAEVAQYILSFISLFIVFLLFLYWISPADFNMITAFWDFYILKRTPRYLSTKGTINKENKLFQDRNGLFLLNVRLNELKKLNTRKHEQYLLKSMIEDMTSVRFKMTGKNKNKLKVKLDRGSN